MKHNTLCSALNILFFDVVSVAIKTSVLTLDELVDATLVKWDVLCVETVFHSSFDVFVTLEDVLSRPGREDNHVVRDKGCSPVSHAQCVFCSLPCQLLWVCHSAYSQLLSPSRFKIWYTILPHSDDSSHSHHRCPLTDDECSQLASSLHLEI